MGRAPRWIITIAVLSIAGVLARAAPALAGGHTSCGEPWTNDVGTVYTCELWPPGPVPVHADADPGSAVVGVLSKGGWANWFASQRHGPTYTEHGYKNDWYAYTMADNGHWGYVSEVYFAQGDDFERDARLPVTVPTPPSPAGRFRVLQMNMCMWGAKYYAKPTTPHKRHGDCFPNPHYELPDLRAHSSLLPAPIGGESPSPFKRGYTAAERHEAGRKRDSVVEQIRTYAPDAVTINEGCRGDIQRIVGRLSGYTFRSVPLGQGRGSHPRRCSVGRGDAVNAIIARSYTPGSEEGGYFQHNGARAWMCILTAGVRVCTAHLSLPRQKAPGGGHAQPKECGILRRKLVATGGHPTVFGGDTNYNYKTSDNCAPAGFFGLRDIELNPRGRSDQSGMQQIYYSPDLSREQSCGHVRPVADTDHKGFLLDLYGVGSPTRGAACTWRAIAPGH